MKKGILMLALLGLIFSASSCKKDDDDDDKSNSTGLGVIEGKVDGTLISLSYLSPGGEEFNQSYEPNFDHTTTLARYRAATDFESWNIFFYNVDWDTVTVPYTFEVDHDHDAYEVEFSYTPELLDFPRVSTTGTITVTKLTSDELHGTFEGTILNDEDTLTVTQGVFRMPYVTVY